MGDLGVEYWTRDSFVSRKFYYIYRFRDISPNALKIRLNLYLTSCWLWSWLVQINFGRIGKIIEKFRFNSYFYRKINGVVFTCYMLHIKTSLYAQTGNWKIWFNPDEQSRHWALCRVLFIIGINKKKSNIKKKHYCCLKIIMKILYSVRC